jgi:hypothetical protein
MTLLHGSARKLNLQIACLIGRDPRLANAPVLVRLPDGREIPWDAVGIEGDQSGGFRVILKLKEE